MFNSDVASKTLSSKRQILSILKAYYEIYKPIVVKQCDAVQVNGKMSVSSVEYWVRLSFCGLGGRNWMLHHEVRKFNII